MDRTEEVTPGACRLATEPGGVKEPFFTRTWLPTGMLAMDCAVAAGTGGVGGVILPITALDGGPSEYEEAAIDVIACGAETMGIEGGMAVITGSEGGGPAMEAWLAMEYQFCGGGGCWASTW
mmetsp:Transcript_23592/g.70212  ORF Transcript_23592/g.70212 Transcript_23592/m.70212 type:complete len:122 (-) Transcript_23592:1163-1528(-)